MDDDRFSALSPRQKACLRLSYDRLRTKEIAAALGISPGTVGKYCTEAIAVLGARDRRHAAEMLAVYEGYTSVGTAPSRLSPSSEGVSGTPNVPPTPSPDGAPTSRRRWLPIRQKGKTDNDLSIIARILWVPILALTLAIAFGMLAIGVRTISQLVFGGQ